MRVAFPEPAVTKKACEGQGLSLTRLSGTRSQIGESSGGNIRHQVTRGLYGRTTLKLVHLRGSGAPFFLKE